MVLFLMILVLSGCGLYEEDPENTTRKRNTNGEFSDVELEVAVNYTGDSLTVFQRICDDYAAEKGVTFVVDNYGSDYANMMITRMAANNMPDVFVTAGWSLRRYKEVSLELTDEPYVAHYNDTARGVIVDTDGKCYAMMMSCGVNGNVINLDVCQAAGVDPYAIKTWDDFLEACEKVKQAGYTAIASTPDAGLTATAAGTFLVYPGELFEVGDKILGGKWDWQEYRAVLEFYQTALSNGYFFRDAKSMNTNDMYERFAANRAAFIIAENTDSIQTCEALNPDGHYCYAPFPASADGGEEVIAVGEGDSFSISKNSRYKEAAKDFLRYLSQTEVTLKLLAVTSRTSCLDYTVSQDNTAGTRALKMVEENFGEGHNLHYHNLFDREYLPSGMWGKMGNACVKIFAKFTDENIDYIISDLKAYYDQLLKDANK